MASLISLFSLTSAHAEMPDDVEVIYVQGQRNQLESNALVENNATYLQLEDSLYSKTNIGQWLASVPGLSLKRSRRFISELQCAWF